MPIVGRPVMPVPLSAPKRRQRPVTRLRMEQTVLFSADDATPRRVNAPVVIETRHADWIRRDMSGVCFRLPQEAYALLADYAPARKLADCVEITALLKSWQSAEPIRQIRRPLYGSSPPAATTTLPCAKDLLHGNYGTQEAVAYAGGKARRISPSWLYNLDDMVLSPMKVQPVGADEIIHVSGVVSWNVERHVLDASNPTAQCHRILDYADRMLHEADASLADLLRVRTYCAHPRVGRIMAQCLAQRIGSDAACVHHVIATLDPGDLDPLCCEVQFVAARVPRCGIPNGVCFLLGGLRHLYFGPICASSEYERIAVTTEAEQLARGVLGACAGAGIQPARIVSLFLECADQHVGDLFVRQLNEQSRGRIRCGVTASVNLRLLERVGRRLVASGAAIGSQTRLRTL